MDKLNDLVEMAEKADAVANLMDAVNPHDILAIAEAFRELEQRAEAAEAQLAELAKQKPAGKFVFEPIGERWHHIKHGEAQHAEPKLPMVKLFTRAAPAALPVDLVPDEMYPDHPKMRWVGIDELFPRIEGWNACRDEMLRRIEER